MSIWALFKLRDFPVSIVHYAAIVVLYTNVTQRIPSLILPVIEMVEQSLQARQKASNALSENKHGSIVMITLHQ